MAYSDGGCGPNAEWKSCGSACPPTCESPNRLGVCIAVCVSGCFCKEGYLKESDDVESFGCEEHEHGSICGHYKEPQCYDFVKKPNFIQCINRLYPGCRCDKDYVRNPHSKKCVKKSDCFMSSLRGWRDNIVDSITDQII
ncbi:Protein of unknown function [Cotesia congregata]|uniref:TIL domain-containing protein n=1 Tax=Cotesia congregata TaxID=51543 RepID=A0A8J2HPK9_COTCN|nr:Protein of unknown function [Cotesia congregata]